MGLKVAIIGLSPSRDGMPFDDPEWETWGLPWDSEHWAKYTRHFEIHDARELRNMPQSYIERLNDCGFLYAQGPTIALPNAKPYPFDAVAKAIGPMYLESSVAYMLALAITEGASEIALYGVDMGDDTEYSHQRANAEYLIGMARGKGITVHIPDVSPVCKYSGEHGYKNRYGCLG